MKPFSASTRRGFTLVEILVALAVLAIIVVAVAQIVGTASMITTQNNKHVDANSQARSVFDRMALDFARMMKRNDVDYIFCKAPGNDTMFFFTAGDSYFDTSTFDQLSTGYTSTTYPAQKNPISLVGYRINNTAGSSTYYQLERLGQALSWDGTPSINPVVFLTYPPAGIDADNVDNANSTNPPNGSYSTAFYLSTLWGAYSNGSGGYSLVGTLANYFNDGVPDDSSVTPPVNPYHVLATQVFRMEFSFQLKDGTLSAIPVMAQSNTQTPAVTNGVLSKCKLTATQRPLPTDDANSDNGTGPYTIGSRWYDTTNQIGYICVSAAPNAALWREIGIQDIAAVVVTLAVLDKQGLVYVNKRGISMATLAGAFADGTDATVAKTWTTAITPPSSGKSPFSLATGVPQEMVSQIRIYQRFFYINNL